MFEVSADAYGAFMGRFAEPLAERFAAVAGIGPDVQVLDVGCGPGALTERLVRLGATVSAIDPSLSFVDAVRVRLPEADVRFGSAELLPFLDHTFDAALAQLVVHFMRDPVAGLTEMARVTRPGGRVAACVWDEAGGTGPVATFWAAAHDVDPSAVDESQLAGGRQGHLMQLFGAAGIHEVEGLTLTVDVAFADFDAWWQPYTYGVGPAGAYVAGLDGKHREALRSRCAQLLPEGPFELEASAWTALGRA